jgi:hypothetical protein
MNRREQVIVLTYLDRLAGKWMEFDLLCGPEMLNLILTKL